MICFGFNLEYYPNAEVKQILKNLRRSNVAFWESNGREYSLETLKQMLSFVNKYDGYIIQLYGNKEACSVTKVEPCIGKMVIILENNHEVCNS